MAKQVVRIVEPKNIADYEETVAIIGNIRAVLYVLKGHDEEEAIKKYEKLYLKRRDEKLAKRWAKKGY